MTKEELRLFIRRQADDIDGIELVSDSDIDAFIDEAEREAFERAQLGRIDSSFNIDVLSGISTYLVNDLIIFIDKAKLIGEPRPLSKTTRLELDYQIDNWEDHPHDKPIYYFQEGNAITLHPTPDREFTLAFVGNRYPVSEMETPSYLHEKLAYWVLYRYYEINDSDISHVAKAAMFLSRFQGVFGNKSRQDFIQSWRDGPNGYPLRHHPFS